MTDKNARSYWIKRKGNTKLSDTAPEQGFAAFAKFKGYTIEQGKSVWVEGWKLTPDFDMKFRNDEVVILVDGRYHWTDVQAKKDRWRDELYVKAGKKVIHIDSGLTDTKYWPWLGEKFAEALTGDGTVIYIHQ